MHVNTSKFLAVIITSLVVSGCVNPVKKQSDALIGSWKIIDIKGQLVDTPKADLNFFADGKVSGNNGCNSITASYSPYGDHLNLTDFATTKMICAGGKADVANAFMKNIQFVEHFLIDGDQLYLTDKQDEAVISLVK